MIDKIIPRFFDSSTDERLLEEGAMTLAQNVTVSENGDGTEGVIKNVNGTVAIEGESAVANHLIEGKNVVVIGTAKDDQNNKIYFFVAADHEDNSGANRDSDAIYEYSSATDEYKVVIRSRRLNFNAESFVKADVVNRNSETILYFTDNRNPPRKINVNRALTTDVYSGSNEEIFKKTIQAIKGASNRIPEAFFKTDTSREVNNFTNEFFQFSVQIIYKDGEESALSPYSQLAIHRPTAHAMLNGEGFGVGKLADNVLSIKHNVNVETTPDLDKIRILARSGNASNFFVVDEFDPRKDVKRDVNGSQLTLFSANGDTYDFYNDHLGSLVSPTVANKMYDNVPLTSEGQTVSGRRLFYSNYTEGYANQIGNVDANDVTRIGIDVVYSSESTQVDHFADGDASSVIVEANDKDITIDLNEGVTGSSLFGGESPTAPSTVPAGTVTKITFRYTPHFDIAGFSHSYEYEDDTGGFPVPDDDTITSFSGIYPENADGINYISVILKHESPVDETLEEVRNELIEQLNGFEKTLKYYASVDSIVGNPAKVHVTFNFEEFLINGATGALADDAAGFDIIPRVTAIRLSGGDVYNSATENITPTYSNFGGTGYLTNRSVSSTSTGLTPTFKVGSSHSFGIVYYDEHNRSGYVNEIGSAYVKYPNERTAQELKGPASIKFTFPNDLQAPAWAKTWQIVYAGTDSYSSAFQYTTGAAYAYREQDSTGAIDESSSKIYVSLKTLDLYKEERPGNNREYSYTKGDKLRVVKYYDTSANGGAGGFAFPTANDGSLIEFDVVGVKTLGANDYDVATAPAEEHQGTFLILEHPHITSGIDTDAAGATGAQLKYDNWDFYAVANSQGVTGVDYPNNDNASNTSNWGKRSVVDIVSLRNHTSEKLYYEIGVGGLAAASTFRGTGAHQFSSVIANSGDYYYRPVTCKSINYDGSWQFDTPQTWDDQVIFLEDSSLTDSVSSKHWSKGRAHVVFEKSASVRRANSVTYSDPFNQDMSTLTLSSFDSSSFSNLDLNYGAARYISDYNGNLLALQENKVSITPISKSIFNQAGGGDGVVSLSSDVINSSNTNYLTGDYGVAQHPESVLVYDNQIFFADSSRSAIVRVSSEGLSPISEKNISSYITSKFSAFNSGTSDYKRIVSGYDPENHIYYVTLRERNTTDTATAPVDDSAVTLGYDVRRGKWQGIYTFYPDDYSHLNNSMYSFKYDDQPDLSGPSGPLQQDHIMHKHSPSAIKNRFYGNTADDSIVEIVSKYNPSSIKVFDSISIEGDDAWSAQVTTPLNQDTGVGNMADSSFKQKEGYWYRDIAGDTSSNSTSQLLAIGTVSSVSGTDITITGGLSRVRVPIGGTIQFVDASSTSALANSNSDGSGDVTVSSVNYDTGVITASAAVNTSIVSGDDVVIVLNSSLNGDRIRGPYAKIKLTLNKSTASELYSVNVNFTNSSLNHALGQ